MSLAKNPRPLILSSECASLNYTNFTVGILVNATKKKSCHLFDSFLSKFLVSITEIMHHVIFLKKNEVLCTFLAKNRRGGLLTLEGTKKLNEVCGIVYIWAVPRPLSFSVHRRLPGFFPNQKILLPNTFNTWYTLRGKLVFRVHFPGKVFSVFSFSWKCSKLLVHTKCINTKFRRIHGCWYS